MSALGQKQTSRSEIAMSALPPKADIAERDWDVRFVPQADILTAVRYDWPHLLPSCRQRSQDEPPATSSFYD
jgi:hypothetical protein